MPEDADDLRLITVRRGPLADHLRYLADQLIRACESLDNKQMPKVGGVAINLQLLAEQIEDGTVQYDGSSDA